MEGQSKRLDATTINIDQLYKTGIWKTNYRKNDGRR